MAKREVDVDTSRCNGLEPLVVEAVQERSGGGGTILTRISGSLKLADDDLQPLGVCCPDRRQQEDDDEQRLVVSESSVVVVQSGRVPPPTPPRRRRRAPIEVSTCCSFCHNAATTKKVDRSIKWASMSSNCLHSNGSKDSNGSCVSASFPSVSTSNGILRQIIRPSCSKRFVVRTEAVEDNLYEMVNHKKVVADDDDDEVVVEDDAVLLECSTSADYGSCFSSSNEVTLEGGGRDDDDDDDVAPPEELAADADCVIVSEHLQPTVVVVGGCQCGVVESRRGKGGGGEEEEEETEEDLSSMMAPAQNVPEQFLDDADSLGSDRAVLVPVEHYDDAVKTKLDAIVELTDDAVVSGGGGGGGASSRSTTSSSSSSSRSSCASSGEVEMDDLVVSDGETTSSKSSKDKLVMKRKQFVDGKIHCLGKKRCFSSSLDGECIVPEYDSFDKSDSSSMATMLPASVLHQVQTLKKRIPTKENPPPELAQWLAIFQCWSNAERLLALDQMIDLCDPTQVRHMMCVIEPQFQRDFISLLPKELALDVLSFLEPKDLLRAAQTCKYWRVLAEDNLLWRSKCREAGIDEVFDSLCKRRSKSGLVPSPWKAAYMRQHNIEMNWRYRPVRAPKVLKGHDDHVITCLQFCDSRIVSGSDDNTLKVWSATNGKCLKTLVGHTGGVWSSQMSGNIIVSGSTDRTLKVWNADTGQCIHTLYGHTSTVRCMHLHGNKVVSGSRDSTLRLWDIGTGLCLHVLLGHVAAVRCVQYDGRLVVSGAYDYMVKVWNPEREECLHTLQGHTNRVYSLQFDGVYVVSGSLDTSIRVWDVETGACKHTLMGHQSLTSGMELKNNILVSGNADSTVKVWDITTGQCLQTLSGPNRHNSAVTCLQFNSKFVITSSDDGTVKLWDLKTGEFIRNLVALDSGGSGGVVWRIRASPTKLVCAVGSRNGTEETKLLVLDFDVEQQQQQNIDANEKEHFVVGLCKK